jgi:hypothetical protein
MSDETNSALLDEERRLASHQEVKASIDGDVNARITINGMLRLIVYRKVTV